MKTIVAGLGAALLAAAVAAPSQAQSPPGTLMSCQVQEVRGSGENSETIYSMNCMPVQGGNVQRVETLPNGETRVVYSGSRPAYAGGPVYVLRFNSEFGSAGDARYGAPLDGNIGTPRR